MGPTRRRVVFTCSAGRLEIRSFYAYGQAGRIYFQQLKRQRLLKTRLNAKVLENCERETAASKIVFSTNDHPLSVWLNYLLYHLSKTNPGREKIEQIEPEPFALSMLALECLAETPTITKNDRSLVDVAVSSPGQQRSYVSDVVQNLRGKLGANELFYDFDYQSQLARPNLDTLLQDIYRNQE